MTFLQSVKAFSPDPEDPAASPEPVVRLLATRALNELAARRAILVRQKTLHQIAFIKVMIIA